MTNQPERGARMNRLRELRQAEGKNWSQARLIKALEDQAALENARLAQRASMKTRLSMWENGHAKPDDFHARLLCQVFGVTEDELGFGATSVIETTSIAFADAAAVPTLAVTPEVVTFLQTVFSQYTGADRMIGPRAVIDVVRAQCRMIEGLIQAAQGSVRNDILRIGGRFFEFSGWLAQDCGDFVSASTWSSRALDMAYETGDAWLISYIFMRRSNIATDSGNPGEGLSLARASLRDGATLGPRLKALGLRQEAAALALSGDELGSARAIDLALEVAETFDPMAPEPAARYCTRQYLQMEGAASWTRLGRPDRAGRLLTDAIETWPEGADLRDKGVGVARLAIVQAMAGNLDASCEAAHSAIEVVRAAPSARAIAELNKLRSRLGPWRNRPEVADLTDLLRDIK